MARLHTRSELARLAGVSPAAITKACKNGLSEACVGRRIDLDHPDVVAYLESKGVTPTKHPPGPREGRSKPTAVRRAKASDESPEEPPKGREKRQRKAKAKKPGTRADMPPELEGLEHLTLEELVAQVGTKVEFKDWLDARKKIADTRSKELQYEEAAGRLIERELVRKHVFGALEAGNRRLLGDAPKTIAARLFALARSGASVEEAEAACRDIISGQLRAVKATAARAIRKG